MFIRVDDIAINMDNVSAFYVDEDEVKFDMKDSSFSWEFDGFEDVYEARNFFSRIYEDVSNGVSGSYKTPEYAN